MMDILRIINKLKKHKGFSTDKEIADLFGLSEQDFNNRKKRGTILPLILNWAVNESVDLEGLFREVQEKANPADSVEVAEKKDTYIKDTEGEGRKITDLLTRATEILDSNSIFRQALAANINAFHLAIRSEEKVHSLQGRIDYLEGQNKSLESRLSALEEKIK
jgi:hypothetical protein